MVSRGGIKDPSEGYDLIHGLDMGNDGTAPAAIRSAVIISVTLSTLAAIQAELGGSEMKTGRDMGRLGLVPRG